MNLEKESKTHQGDKKDKEKKEDIPVNIIINKSTLGHITWRLVHYLPQIPHIAQDAQDVQDASASASAPASTLAIKQRQVQSLLQSLKDSKSMMFDLLSTDYPCRQCCENFAKIYKTYLQTKKDQKSEQNEQNKKNKQNIVDQKKDFNHTINDINDLKSYTCQIHNLVNKSLNMSIYPLEKYQSCSVYEFIESVWLYLAILICNMALCSESYKAITSPSAAKSNISLYQQSVDKLHSVTRFLAAIQVLVQNDVQLFKYLSILGSKTIAGVSLEGQCDEVKDKLITFYLLKSAASVSDDVDAEDADHLVHLDHFDHLDSPDIINRYCINILLFWYVIAFIRTVILNKEFNEESKERLKQLLFPGSQIDWSKISRCDDHNLLSYLMSDSEESHLVAALPAKIYQRFLMKHTGGATGATGITSVNVPKKIRVNAEAHVEAHVDNNNNTQCQQCRWS